MTKIKSIYFFIFINIPFLANAEEAASYIEENKLIIQIQDVNREAEAWATCSAAYEIMSVILKSTPAQARKIKDLSNGATIAVTMSHVTNDLSEDISTEKLSALWAYSQHLAISIPETKKTMMLADAEVLGKDGAELFVEKITKTVEACMKNLDGQQIYIDSWRELAKSGLLQFSNK